MEVTQLRGYGVCGSDVSLSGGQIEAHTDRSRATGAGQFRVRDTAIHGEVENERRTGGFLVFDWRDGDGSGARLGRRGRAAGGQTTGDEEIISHVFPLRQNQCHPWVRSKRDAVTSDYTG